MKARWLSRAFKASFTAARSFRSRARNRKLVLSLSSSFFCTRKLNAERQGDDNADKVVMFLTSVNLAKAKSKYVLMQMLSAAGTGYRFNTKRKRVANKLVLWHFDPVVKQHALFYEHKKIRSI